MFSSYCLISYSLWQQNSVSELSLPVTYFSPLILYLNYFTFSFTSCWLTFIIVSNNVHITKSYNYFSIILFNLSSEFYLCAFIPPWSNPQILSNLSEPDILVSFSVSSFHLWMWVFKNSVLGCVLFSIHTHFINDLIPFPALTTIYILLMTSKIRCTTQTSPWTLGLYVHIHLDI